MWCNSDTGLASVRLHTNRAGLGMVLGPLELSIMQALWEAERPVTTKQLRLAMERAGTTLALSTVSTTLRRLASKALVLEARTKDDVFVYETCMTEDELEAFVVEHIIARLRDTWPEHVASTLQLDD